LDSDGSLGQIELDRGGGGRLQPRQGARVEGHPDIFGTPAISRVLKNPLLLRLLKKVQMQGGAGDEVRGVLGLYVAAPRERANAADGPFSAAC